MGSFINVSISCDCGHVEEWSSQPMMNNMPVGNLIIAGAIMFYGCSPVKALNFMNHASIATISARTYHYMQTAYIVPSINSVWQLHQQLYIDTIKEEGRSLKLGGDARCCSPGHTANMGLTVNKVKNSICNGIGGFEERTSVP
ncbi:hypothetical protein KUTeg_017393 [Tegillarca granosa]|uniref:Uncharacterized protein n=1 Tax=Tegillarca granosa TaxID=220873 RepID=A0ABQ9ENC7_TEGGR|nr:hypothetical protein KUTeg_017393 [Tegillarca granosa]